jgi:hypothetical protein
MMAGMKISVDAAMRARDVSPDPDGAALAAAVVEDAAGSPARAGSRGDGHATTGNLRSRAGEAGGSGALPWHGGEARGSQSRGNEAGGKPLGGSQPPGRQPDTRPRAQPDSRQADSRQADARQEGARQADARQEGAARLSPGGEAGGGAAGPRPRARKRSRRHGK